MVYLHFPSNLTDEELMLKAKYAKLRKKKKALQAFQAPKTEPEKSNSLKRSLEPKDAKEFAKKMILAGKISVSNQSPGQRTVFKRPRGLERKLSEIRSNNLLAKAHGIPQLPSTSTSFNETKTADGSQSRSATAVIPPPIQFQPFTPAKSEAESKGAPDRESVPKYRPIPRKNPVFSKEKPGGSARSVGNEGGNRKSEVQSQGSDSISPGGGFSAAKPKQGHTIHVRAHNITEEMCREVFGKVGNIVNVSMELERSCGFITFDRITTAEKAINDVNGTFVDDVQFHVSFARRQPPVTELINDAPASASWTALASSQSQKGAHQDKRSQVVYDEDI